jgi:hypothetical protein
VGGVQATHRRRARIRLDGDDHGLGKTAGEPQRRCADIGPGVDDQRLAAARQDLFVGGGDAHHLLKIGQVVGAADKNLAEGRRVGVARPNRYASQLGRRQGHRLPTEQPPDMPQSEQRPELLEFAHIAHDAAADAHDTAPVTLGARPGLKAPVSTNEQPGV